MRRDFLRKVLPGMSDAAPTEEEYNEALEFLEKTIVDRNFLSRDELDEKYGSRLPDAFWKILLNHIWLVTDYTYSNYTKHNGPLMAEVIDNVMYSVFANIADYSFEVDIEEYIKNAIDDYFSNPEDYLRDSEPSSDKEEDEMVNKSMDIISGFFQEYFKFSEEDRYLFEAQLKCLFDNGTIDSESISSELNVTPEAAYENFVNVNTVLADYVIRFIA